MKIFVSGQIKDLDYVRNIQNKLVKAGHEITHDWTNKLSGDTMLSGRQAKLDNVEESSKRAKADIKGVLDCDAYVICTNNHALGKGMYVELGAALALNETIGKPRIFLIGPMNHLSIFYFHPSVKHTKTFDGLIKELSKSNK